MRIKLMHTPRGASWEFAEIKSKAAGGSQEEGRLFWCRGWFVLCFYFRQLYQHFHLTALATGLPGAAVAEQSVKAAFSPPVHACFSGTATEVMGNALTGNEGYSAFTFAFSSSVKPQKHSA